MKRKLLLLNILVFTVSLLFSAQLPKRPQWVNDQANLLSNREEQQLTTYLKSVEEKIGAQIVVLTVPSTGGESIESFSLRVAEKWEIGQKGKDNGVLFVVAKNDRELRIEVGYGLESELTDAKCSYIIRNTVVPFFKANRYSEGIIEGTHTIGKVVLGELTITPSEMRQGRSSSSGGGNGFVVFIIVVVIFFRVIFAVVAPRHYTGVLLLDILFSLLGSGNHRGGGGFGGGGFGGGGGFSGGGGSFGGGGSSGSW